MPLVRWCSAKSGPVGRVLPRLPVNALASPRAVPSSTSGQHGDRGTQETFTSEVCISGQAWTDEVARWWRGGTAEHSEDNRRFGPPPSLSPRCRTGSSTPRGEARQRWPRVELGLPPGAESSPSPEEELAARRHLPEPRRGELFARLPGLRTATGPDGTRLGSELNENGGCPFSQTRERGAHLLLTAWPDCPRVRSGNADVCRRGEGPPWNQGPDRSPRPVSH